MNPYNLIPRSLASFEVVEFLYYPVDRPDLSRRKYHRAVGE